MLVDLLLAILIVALAAYAVLGGADFGAGFWDLTAGGARRGARLRGAAHRSMGPVREANQVWLIVVLVVLWTCFPRAFGPMMETLYVPLFLAAVGIIFRGAAYALRGEAASISEARARRRLRAVLGGDALLPRLHDRRGGLRRRPGRRRAGPPVRELDRRHPALDRRAGDRRPGRDPRGRSRLYDGLTSGGGLAMVVVSAAVGLVTLWLLWTNRFEIARYTFGGGRRHDPRRPGPGAAPGLSTRRAVGA